MKSQFNVVLFGATGLVGNEVLNRLQTDEAVTRIDLFSRRSLENLSDKVFTHVCDLTSVDEIASFLKESPPDLALCCLGTTLAKAGSKEAFYQVDHDLILNAAKACQKVGVKSFGVVSSLGANTGSRNFYLRVKGETERDLKTLGFEKLVIIRPSVLVGKRKENRFFEKILVKASPLLNPLFVGSLRKYRFVSATDVAACLVWQAFQDQKKGCVVIENEEITKSLPFLF